jgi:hypothetical protein
MPNYNRTIIYISELDIDGTVGGVSFVTRTRLSTDGLVFQPIAAYVRVITAQNVNTPATINVGTNGPNFTNILNGEVVNGQTGVTAADSLSRPRTLPVDTDINVNVTVPATGTNPTLKFRVMILGVEV